MFLKLWQLLVEFHDSSVLLPAALVLFFLLLSFFLHPFSPLEDILKYLIQGWGLECTLSHTFSVPKHFTHSIKDNFPHTNVFICEMAFKASVDGRRQTRWAKSTCGGALTLSCSLHPRYLQAWLAVLQPLPLAMLAARAMQTCAILRRKAMGWELWRGSHGGVCTISGGSPRYHWVPDFWPRTFALAGRVLLRKYRTAAWRQPENMEASKKTSLCICPGWPLGAGLGAAGPVYCK